MDRAAKATIRDTRTHNERLALTTIYNEGPISRAQVARLTGLTRTTVSDLVASLLDAGLVREAGLGPSTGGKAPILLEVFDDARYLVGIDLGDVRFRGVLMDMRGRTIREAAVPAGDGEGERALAQLASLVTQLIAGSPRPILGIGIGAPGLIDTREGNVVQAVNVDWTGLPLARIIAEQSGLPVYVANDSQVVAVAEHAFGPEPGPNLVAVKVGRGIGAGVIINDALYQGDGYGAGEIGHTRLSGENGQCRCGGRGCLETVASGPAVLRRIASALGTHASMEQAVAAMQAGDERVRSIVIEAGEQLGTALAGVVSALDVRRIVLVGDMTSFGEPWLTAVRDRMAVGALRALTKDVHIELGSGEDVVILGAAALLMRRELGLSLRLQRDLAARPPDGKLPTGTADHGMSVLPGTPGEPMGVAP